MRVLLLPSAYAPAVGGVEVLTRQLSDHLVARADETEIWTNRHPATLPVRELIGGTLIRRFDMPLPKMDAAALAVFPGAATHALWRMRAAAREFRPDVLHVQCFGANGVFGTALATVTGIPLVVSLQGETVMDDQDVYVHSRSLRAGLRVGLRRAGAVTGCSQFVLDDAEQRFGLASGSATVVPNGVAFDARETEVPLELPFARFVLGLGRVVEKKGFDLLVRAFQRTAAAHADTGLVIGGDGAARPALGRLVSELGLESRVVLPGTLRGGQVEWAMAHAAAFVLPSRVEPFGIVVLEALRAGVPVVVSSHGGAREIVRDERDGLVVDPLDVVAMATAIARVLDDGALARRLSDAAARRARDYSWGTISERYQAIYRDTVGAIPLGGPEDREPT